MNFPDKHSELNRKKQPLHQGRVIHICYLSSRCVWNEERSSVLASIVYPSGMKAVNFRHNQSNVIKLCWDGAPDATRRCQRYMLYIITLMQQL